MNAGEPRRPLLRYYGGKWRAAKWIASHFPPHSTYVEPFGGAASVLLRKRPSLHEVYNDLDADVVNLMRVVQGVESCRLLTQQMRATVVDEGVFLQARERADDPVEDALRLLIHSAWGFGGTGFNRERKTGYRGKSAGGLEKSMSEWRTLPDALLTISRRLQGVTIRNDAALDVIAEFDASDTLFYVDPPYVGETRGGAPVYRHEMLDATQHIELAEALGKCRGAVVLSGYPCPLYDDVLFSGWQRADRKARSERSTNRTEVLWWRKAA